MTIQLQGAHIPEWTQGERLAKARRETGLSVDEFAQVIGISPKSVNNAEGDKVKVRPIVLNMWSFATGIPLEWLEHGVMPDSGTTPPGGGQPDPDDAPVSELVARQRAELGRKPPTRQYVAALIAA